MGDIPVPELILRYDGLFDFDGLYATIVDWAKNFGYMWHEADYKHKVPSPKGAEQEYVWEMSIKVDEFMSYKIAIFVHVWDLLEVEVDMGGRKKNLSNARISFLLKGFLTPDQQHIFDRTPSGKRFGKWYDSLFSKEISNYYDQLYYRMQNLHAVIKQYFDMQAKKHVYKGYLGEN